MIKAMMRGKVEEAKVNNSSADIKINSMVEFFQAAVPWVITTITLGPGGIFKKEDGITAPT